MWDSIWISWVDSSLQMVVILVWDSIPGSIPAQFIPKSTLRQRSCQTLLIISNVTCYCPASYLLSFCIIVVVVVVTRVTAPVAHLILNLSQHFSRKVLGYHASDSNPNFILSQRLRQIARFPIWFRTEGYLWIFALCLSSPTVGPSCDNLSSLSRVV